MDTHLGYLIGKVLSDEDEDDGLDGLPVWERWKELSSRFSFRIVNMPAFNFGITLLIIIVGIETGLRADQIYFGGDTGATALFAVALTSFSVGKQLFLSLSLSLCMSVPVIKQSVTVATTFTFRACHT